MDSLDVLNNATTRPASVPSPPPNRTTVVEDLLQTLEHEGVRHLFGVPGGAIVPLYAALARGGAIRPVLAKHEAGAAFMADGYARVGRTLGVCCATAGPGATNALTGVASAFMDSVPMLFLSGQVSTAVFGRGAVQESSSFGVDLVDLFRPVTKLSAMFTDPRSAPRLLRLALRTARTGRPGPVHLSLPGNVVTQPVPEHERYAPFKLTSAPVDPADIDAAIALLSRAERPCILAGHGVNVAGAWAELLQFAERYQLPVASTPQAKGVFPEDHPLSLGVFGFGGHSLASEYLLGPSVDTLLVIGSSLGEFQTNAWDPRLAKHRRLIQIDIDPREIGKNYPVTLGILADVRAALRALDQRLGELSNGSRMRSSLTSLIKLRQSLPRHLDAERMVSEATPIKPQRLIHGMQRVLPEDTILFLDEGNCMSWLMHYYEIRRPRTFFTNQGLASMGYSVPAAVGAAFAAPDQPIVALLGDGAFAMNGIEVHTAVEYDLPIVFIVLNDGGLGMVEHGDTLVTGRPVCPSRYRTPLNIALMAESMGAHGVRVESPATFEEALHAALRLRRPCVIDARIDPTEVPAMLRVRTDALRRMFEATESRL
jgi:acetolactate synthase-1/2/3 large subunit